MTQTQAITEDQVVEFNGKRCRLVQKNGTIAVVVMTDDEVADDCSDELVKGINKANDCDLQKIMNEAYSELKQELKSKIKDTALKTLGFNSSWGRGWEVDHCNGRMSTISELVSSDVKDFTRTTLSAWVRDSLAGMQDELKKAVQDEVKREIRYATRKVVDENLQAELKARAKEVINNVAGPEKVAALMTSKILNRDTALPEAAGKTS